VSNPDLHVRNEYANVQYRINGILLPEGVSGSCRWDNTLMSVDSIFGSGLRGGFANLDHVQPYTQVNLGISHDFNIWQAPNLSICGSLPSISLIRYTCFAVARA
jgi:hypothetical protein